MNIDFTQVVLGLFGLVNAMAVAAIPFIVPLLRQRLHWAITADQQAGLERVVQGAAGDAYNFGVSLIQQGGLSNPAILRQAIENGAQKVMARLPETAAGLGLTPEAAARMVASRLGSLLATDPTVTAGSPDGSQVTPVQPTPPPPPVVQPEPEEPPLVVPVAPVVQPIVPPATVQTVMPHVGGSFVAGQTSWNYLRNVPTAPNITAP